MRKSEKVTKWQRMVEKKGKHGVRTGNTLRAINTKQFRKYRREACIVWRSTSLHGRCRDPEQYDYHDGANLPCKDLLFSLNKQNRWLLPDLIKAKIDTDEYLLREGFDTFRNKTFEGRIELVERHKICKNNNCIAICLSAVGDDDGKLKVRGYVKDKERGYCDADNVTRSYPTFSRRTKRHLFLGEAPVTFEGSKEQQLTKESQSADDVTRVRLEVFYPSELTSVLSLKAKAFGHETRRHFECNNYIRKPWIQIGYSFRKGRARRENETIRCHTTNDRKRRIKGHSDCESVESSPRKVLLYDYILKAFQQKNINLSQVEQKIEVKHSLQESVTEPFELEEDEPTNQILIPPIWPLHDVPYKEVPDHESDVEAPEHSSLTILLPTEEVTPETLTETFTHEYLECNSSPRRFVLNISKLVSDLDGIGSALKLVRSQKVTFCWLVFVHVLKHPQNTSSQQTYKVLLKVNTMEGPSEVKPDNIEENSLVHINSIIAKTLQYLRENIIDNLYYEQSQRKVRQVVPQKHRSLLEEVKQWASVSYVTDRVSYVKEQLVNAQKNMVKPAASTFESSGTRPVLCHICYRYATEYLSVPPCFHSFCISCWKMYVDESIRTAIWPLTCPQYLCDSMLDLGTVISFGNIKDLLSLLTRSHYKSIDSNPFTVWCTNEDCGRIIVVNEVDSVIAQCSCGESRCTSCLGNAHWPISCQCNLSYLTKLINTYDKDMVPHEFTLKYDCKYCKACFKILKRYDKCCIEFCPCESTLCHRCSILFHAYKNPLYQETVIQGISEYRNDSALEINETERDGVRSDWYKLAIKHRLQRHPFRIAKLHASAKLMATRLAHYMLKEERKCHFIYLDYDTSEHYFTESDKVGKYLEHTIEMYRSVSSYVECIAVYMESLHVKSDQTDMLHRQAMTLSTCARTIFDLCKDGALMNSKSLLAKISKTRGEIRRLMEEIVELTRLLRLPEKK